MLQCERGGKGLVQGRSHRYRKRKETRRLSETRAASGKQPQCSSEHYESTAPTVRNKRQCSIVAIKEEQFFFDDDDERNNNCKIKISVNTTMKPVPSARTVDCRCLLRSTVKTDYTLIMHVRSGAN